MNTHLQSAEVGELYAALVAAQADGLIAIEASANKQVGSKYADLVAVWEAVRPVLKTHRLAIAQHIGAVRKEGDEHVIGLRTTLAHASGQYISQTGEFIISFIALSKGGFLSKTWASASAVTYLRRYGMLAILGIVTGEDDDAQKFAQSQSVEPSAPATPPAECIPISLEDGEFAGFVRGGWKSEAGPDGRPYREYKNEELRRVANELIAEDHFDPIIAACLFDGVEARLRPLRKPLAEALTERGWTDTTVVGQWNLAQFRDAAQRLLTPASPAKQ